MTARHIISATALFTCLIGCAEVELPVSNPQIVVEGWIESGGYPVVMLTTTVPVGSEIQDEEHLKEYIINWGKVTVSDGEKEIVLTGKKNEDYFPPYIYTTTRIRGEAGKTYSLKVEYSQRTVTARTTIPEPVPLEYLRVGKAKNAEDKYTITGGLKDDPSRKDYYKIFTKTFGKDSIFTPSFMGLINDEILTESVEEIAINGNRSISDSEGSIYFDADDYVMIRFCSLDHESWMYWNDFDEISSLSTNPFFPVTSRIRSNISGGLGYWAGYGATHYMVSVRDSLQNF